jgi:hypothetical protein
MAVRLVGDRTTTGARGLFAMTNGSGARVDVIVASFLPSRRISGSLIILALIDKNHPFAAATRGDERWMR